MAVKRGSGGNCGFDGNHKTCRTYIQSISDFVDSGSPLIETATLYLGNSRLTQAGFFGKMCLGPPACNPLGAYILAYDDLGRD